MKCDCNIFNPTKSRRLRSGMANASRRGMKRFQMRGEALRLDCQFGSGEQFDVRLTTGGSR